ncbi:NTF2-like N-terminal transpeptidase domain-containing protein [Actinacidiphila alni]|uniref:NTF2-like N-terminal transpeptidase domain-containing protein n=1 Tax=Actinacidiphila alni TaxID=380248 RepID=A0A1I2H222_9ACTN|nr:penicillin-binding transpeptidase domain-containing protein [Actinacidiphila alni]SFF23309.1 NTF2-like N-terminal transpeptidase domain-containing protein [Actinacidiphila alni]
MRRPQKQPPSSPSWSAQQSVVTSVPPIGRLHRAAAPRRRTAVRTAAALAVVLALAAGGSRWAGIGPLAGHTSTSSDAPAADPAAVAQARAFLADWSRNRYAAAAARTTAPSEADRILDSFTSGLDIERPRLSTGPAQAGKDGAVDVPFTAHMPVKGLGTWTYSSELPLRRDTSGTWTIDWALSVVHPHLTTTAKFSLVREDGPAAPRVNDRTGKPLTADDHPALAPVLERFAAADGPAGPRGAVELVDRVTGEIKGTEVRFGPDPSGEAVATTLDGSWQSAAENALRHDAGGKNASLVVLRVDNGAILALANSPADGFNRAVSGTYAPGSTWKLVTSSALLLKNAVTPATVVDCPRYLTVGKQFHNVETSEFHGATFAKDFAESCNTAFISLRDRLGSTELGDVARTYFGVGQDWHIGVPSYDGSVPAPKDETEKAASMIGQARLQANPLIMASVTATAASGHFHQPHLVPGTPDTTSTRPLPARITTALRSMMRTTVTGGTARLLADLPGSVGAKTGTAEVSDTAPNNGWLVVHRGNIAIACVVEAGVTGGGSAGPIVHDILRAMPDDPS